MGKKKKKKQNTQVAEELRAARIAAGLSLRDISNLGAGIKAGAYRFWEDGSVVGPSDKVEGVLKKFRALAETADPARVEKLRRFNTTDTERIPERERKRIEAGVLALRKLRVELGLTQALAAEICGVPVPSYRAWETLANMPSEEIISQIQKTLRAADIPKDEVRARRVRMRNCPISNESASAEDKVDLDFALELRCHRVQAGLSQKEAAQICGVAHGTYVNWEKAAVHTSATKKEKALAIMRALAPAEDSDRVKVLESYNKMRFSMPPVSKKKATLSRDPF